MKAKAHGKTGLKTAIEWHLAPKRGEIKTQCCGKPLWELKHEDGHGLTHKAENCTCWVYLFPPEVHDEAPR